MRRFRLAALLLYAVLPAPLIAQDLSQPHVSDQVLVRFQPGVAANERVVVRQALAARGGSSLSLVDGLEVLQIGLDVPQAMAVLANNPNVLYAEPDYIVRPIGVPNDFYYDLQWGHHNTGQDIRGVPGVPDADIDMPEAWDTVAGTQAVVAVIDTGTQWDHEDLAANVWVNEDEVLDGTDTDNNGFVDDVRGWDFVDGDADPSDGDGHGTHTAGTIAAVRGNGIGVAGVCACRVMLLRFLGPLGGTTSGAIAALQYAVDNGATVSNNSWGGGAYSQALYDAIQAAGNAEHVFVAAAGNSGTDIDVFPTYPAAYDLPNIISVAATDNLDQRAGFSNYGYDSVDIGAPGLDIASTYFDPTTEYDDYWWNSGTSMAAPHVAGVAALLHDPSFNRSATEVVDRLLLSARPVQTLVGLVATGGVVNASNAINGVFPPPLPVPPGPPATPDDLSATDSTNGSAMLSWTAVADSSYYLIEWEERRKNGRRIDGGSFQLAAQMGAGETETHEHGTGARAYLYYRIAAGNSSGNSVMSGWVDVRVTDGSEGDSGGSDGCHPKKGC